MTSLRSVMRSRSSGFGSVSASGLSGAAAAADDSDDEGGLASGGSKRSYFRTRLKAGGNFKFIF